MRFASTVLKTTHKSPKLLIPTATATKVATASLVAIITAVVSTTTVVITGIAPGDYRKNKLQITLL